jgi:hypothetical protein
MRPAQLLVSPRIGRPGPNQIPAELKRAVERPQGMRLEFEGGLIADMRRAEFERVRENKDWWIEFPSASLRVI